MKYLRRLLCALVGHKDTVLAWGVVRHLSGNRIAREVSEVCERCGATLAVSTLRLEAGRWVA